MNKKRKFVAPNEKEVAQYTEQRQKTEYAEALVGPKTELREYLSLRERGACMPKKKLTKRDMKLCARWASRQGEELLPF